MKTFVCVVLLGLLSISFDPPVKTLVTYRPFFNDQLKGWSGTVRNLWLSSFNLKDSLSFDDINYMDPKTDLKDFYSIYKPLLYFSEDRTQFIDIYSYGLNLERKGNKLVANEEVEQGISLCDFQTNRWERILIFGTDARIEDVCWVSKYQFIMVGSTSDYTSFKRIPLVYIGDVLKRKCYEYLSGDTSCIQANDYRTPQYIAMHIQE